MQPLNPLLPPAPARILMTADTLGGVWTYALDLCHALKPFGTRILLATMGAPLTPDQHLQLASLDHVQLAESSYKLEWMEQPWDDVRHAGTWLLDLERQFQPDLIHLNNYAHGDLPWSAPVLIVTHSCVLSWWLAVKGCPAPSDWSQYRASVRQGLAAADLVVSPSSAMLASVVQHYGPPRQARVIPNSCRRHNFPTTPKQPFILTAGRFWDEAKNSQALVACAGQLPWKTYFAGTTTTHSDPSAAAQFLGHCPPPRIAELFAQASIYAHPARYEPFGLAPLEAATAGCALVLGDIPSLREIWGDAAIFADPDDPTTLLAALRRLIDDPAELAHRAYQARQHARRYSATRMTAAYLAAYTELTSSARRPPLTRSA